MNPISPPFERTELDVRIWRDELDEFVPRRVFDVHTHVYRWSFNLDLHKDASPYRALLGTHLLESTWERLDDADALLMPGREVHRLAFPFPFPHPCDFEASNRFLAIEVARDPASAGLMLVHPGMSAEQVEADVGRYGFVGFKPYRWYATSGDAVDAGITEFMPEHQLAVADRRGLIVMMHLSRRDAIGDPRNVDDLLRLCGAYPGVRWILAHCARSYSAWAIESAARRLRGLPNVWYDVSSVCESDAIDALFTGVGADRVMYGSDDLPVGVLRGKYVSFGRAWAYLSETNHAMSLAHCDGRMTFTRYEQLRAMKRAAMRLGMTTPQREALFHGTARDLVARAADWPS
ncbi:MAG: amidohydrolase family protein [Isosphaeraceae bacterium]